MKALFISPQQQTITPVDIDSHADIVKHIGFETIISDAIGTDSDRLFFDEECFIRGATGRFQIDALVPVAGNGIIIGASADGTELHDVSASVAAIAARIKYL